MSTYESAKNHPILNEILRGLVINQFCDDYDYKEQKVDVDSDNLIKAGWLASILAGSPEEGHQFIAASFAKLLYLQNSNDEQKTQLSYTILSRTGNLAAARHLHNIFDGEVDNPDKKFKKSFGTELDIEIGVKRNQNKLKIENYIFFVTDFQRKLWDNLIKHDKVAISAPTSAGKSFFTQHFIANLFLTKEEFRVIYIVPTKALISQVSEDFKKKLKQDVVIRTAFIDDVDLLNVDVEPIPRKKKELYCVTPERCLKLLQEGWKGVFSPDLIFIDEIQNVETNDNRGVLLEYVISQISSLWIGAKILFAGPFIVNGVELYKKLLSIKAEDVHTYLPAVYQLRITIKQKSINEIKISIHLFGNKTHSFEVPFDFKEGKLEAKKYLLAPIVKRFGKNEANLIYASKANWCVDYAIQFITELGKANKPPKLHPALQDFIELLKEEIHPNYFLIFCLGYKVGFHHGKLPDVVRNEIEYLFVNNHINYLFCTSTLLQGVNLPAPRMFVVSATKDNKPLSGFEFGNLIGRAGRVRDSMVGTVFCLEKSTDGTSWSNEYFNSNYTKTVVPATDVALQRNVQEISTTMKKEPKFLSHSGEEYTNNLIKQKFVQSPDALKEFLNNKELGDDKVNAIMEMVSEQLVGISIPSNLVRLNPNIDPVLQNILFEKIKTEKIEEWVLIDEDGGNMNYRSRMRREESTLLKHSEWSFYFQFEFLLKKLDDIFAIWKEAQAKGVPMGAQKMAFYGVTWLDSLTYAQLIRKELGYFKKVDDEIQNPLAKLKKTNERINRVFTVNSTIVTYLLVKYFKLLTDILDTLMSAEQKKTYRRTLSLPTMLELGTRKIDVLIMISTGIPRPVALKLSAIIPLEQKERPIDWLAEITELRMIGGLKKYYKRYLYRKGYLSSLKESEIPKL